MASWTHEVKLSCPECLCVVEELDFVVKFVMINGERHKTYSEWRFQCGHTLLDNLHDTEWEENEAGETWSAILNELREPILVWKEGVF
jgi:hypothetical protein